MNIWCNVICLIGKTLLMQDSCSVTHCFSFALVLRWSGGGAASHLQPYRPIRHVDFVRACRCAYCCHTHGAHCALPCKFALVSLCQMGRLRNVASQLKISLKLFSGEKSNSADDVPQQDLQLAPSHRHRLRSAHFHQLACYFCPKYPWNLWSYWWVQTTK